jgi:tetratricopeptide (TPR) repeat protein
MGDKFAENKIVCFINPLDGYKLMMITWADLIGVVSGMNEKGLTVTLNASRSTVPTQAATPVTLLAREILQYASSIDEAYAIAKKRKLFVSESIMIGSSKDHETAIIEKSPDSTALFGSSSDEIICSNHFQSKTFENDRHNIENIKGSDSYQRYQRVRELLDRYNKPAVEDAAAILRDQRVAGDQDAGMGNQLSINQLIAHHSVIFKPDSLIVWVSTSPWQLGKYVAYDLHTVFNLKPADIAAGKEIYRAVETIPADTFLYSKAFTQFQQYRQMTIQLREYGKSGKPLPAGFADNFVASNPRLYQTYVSLAAYYEELKDYTNALKYYSQALTKILPGQDERNKLTERARKISKKIQHGHSKY